MYVSRKLQFAGMLLRVSGLWAQGDKVMSGAVVDTTRVREYCVYMKVIFVVYCRLCSGHHLLRCSSFFKLVLKHGSLIQMVSK